MWTSILGFLRRSLLTLPYLAAIAGPLCVVGGLIIGFRVDRFVRSAEEATVRVVRVDSRNDEARRVFRPVFAATVDGRTIEHAGTFWVAPQPHATGDEVPGRVDRETGEIRSDLMIAAESRAGEGLVGLGLTLLIFAAAFFIARSLLRRQKGAGP